MFLTPRILRLPKEPSGSFFFFFFQAASNSSMWERLALNSQPSYIHLLVLRSSAFQLPSSLLLLFVLLLLFRLLLLFFSLADFLCSPGVASICSPSNSATVRQNYRLGPPHLDPNFFFFFSINCLFYLLCVCLCGCVSATAPVW